MTQISNFIIPSIIIIMIFHGVFKGVNVFSEFTSGAKDGFTLVLNILPSLIGLIFSIELLKASGGLDTLCSILSPVTSFLGIPKETTPLTVLSPISGSGSLGMFESLLKDHGPDSFIGRCASVMMGSTETTFYTLAVYFGSVGIKNSRYTAKAALSADLCGMLLAVFVTRLYFGG